jgi:hypothetical protein
MMEWKGIDQRPEAQTLRALSDRGEENAGRGGKAERRRVMLGGMICIEAATVIGFDDLQPLLVKRVQGPLIAVQVIENADFHWPSLHRSYELHHLQKRVVQQDRLGYDIECAALAAHFEFVCATCSRAFSQTSRSIR